jgi:hypothetical protein
MAAMKPIDPGHPYSTTKHINFQLYRQAVSAAPYGYDHFISVPPGYDQQPDKKWPLVVFLHGAGESKRGPNESYACLRHGVPKIILCYDKLKEWRYSRHRHPARTAPGRTESQQGKEAS